MRRTIRGALSDRRETERSGAISRFARARPLLAIGLVLLLEACTYTVDSEQLRICRSVLPALHPGGRVAVLRAENGIEPDTVRIEYTVEAADGTQAEHWAVCRFPAAGLAANKADLLGVTTPDGPLSGASVYLLKKYYLDTPEGVAGDPGSNEEAAVPEVPRPFAYALQQLLVSLPRTAIYGLLAVAYALVFGLVGRINLAFGELAAIGAAATIAGAALVSVGGGVTTPLAGLGAGLLAALFAGAIYGAVGGHFTIARIATRSSQPSLIATVGLSLALMEYLRVAQSPVTVWLPPIWSEAWPLARAEDFLVSLTPITVVTAGIGLAAALGLLWLVQATGFGRAWRAYADDAQAAALMGVDGLRLLVQTLALAGAMAGLSGMLIVAQYGGLGFAGGFQYGLKALIAAVIGGIGSIPGAMLGGFAVGLFETLWSAYLPIEVRDMALYVALVVFLIFRPGGLLGFRDPTPRPV